MAGKQTNLRIGVDVGGTFTDLVAWDGQSLNVIKLPSTPPQFERAVIEATNRAIRPDSVARLVHGSTVATNALLQRTGEPIAFVTTEGFRDMLLIGRQNRPGLYALRVERPAPICPPEQCFTVRERMDSRGVVVTPLVDAEIDVLIARLHEAGLKHVAVCLLFSFANPAHEQMIGRRLGAAGFTVSLSCELLPEFREYERASTVAINASMRPVVSKYLDSLQSGLPSGVEELRIMQSGGGTVDVESAGREACRLVLSGPAGGAFGATWIARQVGAMDAIGYDMGGTSTDVSLILNGQPQWTSSSTIDGLPIGLPMLDIQTVGAGGGSIATVDIGGALRVGPSSAGAIPGPACYGRGGTSPTVTDANLVLGRILPERFLGGQMRLDVDAAHRAIEPLAARMGKSVVETAIGIRKVAEANMAHAIRAATARRGHDPRSFALVSFGGAGGLHACALAESLEMSRVIVPPYCGVLSALGMIIAPPIADASRTVVQLGDLLDDDRLAAEYGGVSAMTLEQIPFEQTASVEVYADVRFKGQSHELKVRINRPSREAIESEFHSAYQQIYGSIPASRAMEIVTLRVRRIGHAPALSLPEVSRVAQPFDETIQLVVDGKRIGARGADRAALLGERPQPGPALILDPEATTYVPPGWTYVLGPSWVIQLEQMG